MLTYEMMARVPPSNEPAIYTSGRVEEIAYLSQTEQCDKQGRSIKSGLARYRRYPLGFVRCFQVPTLVPVDVCGNLGYLKRRI